MRHLIFSLRRSPVANLPFLHFAVRQLARSSIRFVNTPVDVGLPADSIDLAFIADTYHHFEYPRQTMASIHQALRSAGRVIIIDFRRDPRFSSRWVMGHVRGNKAQVIEELQVAGFRLVDDKPLMRTNYFLEFVKSEIGSDTIDRPTDPFSH